VRVQRVQVLGGDKGDPGAIAVNRRLVIYAAGGAGYLGIADAAGFNFRPEDFNVSVVVCPHEIAIGNKSDELPIAAHRRQDVVALFGLGHLGQNLRGDRIPEYFKIVVGVAAGQVAVGKEHDVVAG